MQVFRRPIGGEKKLSAWSPKGRLGQKSYWINVGIILGIRFAAAAASIYRPDWDFVRHMDFLLVLVAILVGKRMKDFGMAPYWGWLAMATISLGIPIVAVVYSPVTPNPADPLDIYPSWVGLIGVSVLALVVFVGLRKGDAGVNRYGPVVA